MQTFITASGYAALQPSSILEKFTYSLRPLEPFEVLIRVTHCGLCHTDLHMMENNWGRSTYPLLPGHEIVGFVEEKGSFASYKIGERVAVGWIHSTCMECTSCKRGETNICQKKKGIYNRGSFGGFATHVIADSRFLFSLPEGLSSLAAAPLLCAGATVYSPFTELGLQKGQKVAVVGIGGLGHLALQFGNALGFEMVAISSSAKKKEDAYKLGATSFYTIEKLPKEPFLDFILCTVDQQLDWNCLLQALHPKGTLCFISRPSQGISIDPTFLVSTQRKIIGSNNASLARTQEMLLFAKKHNVLPWIEEMPLSQINEGLERLKRNEVRYRIVFAID